MKEREREMRDNMRHRPNLCRDAPRYSGTTTTLRSTLTKATSSRAPRWPCSRTRSSRFAGSPTRLGSTSRVRLSLFFLSCSFLLFSFFFWLCRLASVCVCVCVVVLSFFLLLVEGVCVSWLFPVLSLFPSSFWLCHLVCKQSLLCACLTFVSALSVVLATAIVTAVRTALIRITSPLSTLFSTC